MRGFVPQPGFAFGIIRGVYRYTVLWSLRCVNYPNRNYKFLVVVRTTSWAVLVHQITTSVRISYPSKSRAGAQHFSLSRRKISPAQAQPQPRHQSDTPCDIR